MLTKLLTASKICLKVKELVPLLGPSAGGCFVKYIWVVESKCSQRILPYSANTKKQTKKSLLSTF